MAMNEDLENGLKFLLKASKAVGINIRKYSWVTDLSLLLSKHNSCYKFWYAVNKQRKLSNIPYCNNVYDILFNVDLSLVRWYCSDDGYDYWSNVFQSIFYPRQPLPPMIPLKKLLLTDMHKSIISKGLVVKLPS